ncbi:choline-sulfatase [Eremomyces bilateralis CBS 781.70]|uniref:Choline-sulfatase n=1 Tax=Eremomyces bilateralis CBS 781.70 TaxID=1392243 RepID=A0A6G1FS22_9PEZI|nr:choline-sulfatase [Eremomyces bilateralis CBS 781.70]KAF1808491.1 choline-sulfatase [Eremomyces bilateralis CBS 781.70]
MAPHAESPPLPESSWAENGPAYLPSEHTEAVKPNILYIMADQLAAPLLRMHDAKSPIITPHLDSLAESGVVFDSAYCNSPLCAPSRFCMVTGQLPSKIGAYDNASFLPSDVPTFAHMLRGEGYETTLAGKMHFIGPDQLHGFENRLTPDIYPADFGWAVNWDNPEERLEWYHNMSSVYQAGPCVRSNQLDYDEEVMHKSTQYLYDYVRQGKSQRPFSLTVSLTHPHDPYAISKDLWDLYEDVDIPMPEVVIPQDQQDPHSTRLLKCIDAWDNDIPEEAVKRARRAYYAACTYVDNQIGKLLRILKECSLDKNTVVIFSGDHGDMLGERGLWYKMNWFEMSSRVPLVINYPPRFNHRRVKESVSTLDLPFTLLELVAGPKAVQKWAALSPIDGRSIYPALVGRPVADEVIGEYMGEGAITPVVMIRRGKWKYVASLIDPPQLYNLADDPHELTNFANAANTTVESKTVAASFEEEVRSRWDLPKVHQRVLLKQRERRLIWNALRKGKFQSWDFEGEGGGQQQYIRSNIPLDDLELRARYPPVDDKGKTLIVAVPHGQAGAQNE